MFTAKNMYKNYTVRTFCGEHFLAEKFHPSWICPFLPIFRSGRPSNQTDWNPSRVPSGDPRAWGGVGVTLKSKLVGVVAASCTNNQKLRGSLLWGGGLYPVLFQPIFTLTIPIFSCDDLLFVFHLGGCMCHGMACMCQGRSWCVGV